MRYLGHSLKFLYGEERRTSDFVLYVLVYKPMNLFVGEYGAYTVPREFGIPGR